jgi:hypothetical protein
LEWRSSEVERCRRSFHQTRAKGNVCGTPAKTFFCLTTSIVCFKARLRCRAPPHLCLCVCASPVLHLSPFSFPFIPPPSSPSKKQEALLAQPAFQNCSEAASAHKNTHTHTYTNTYIHVRTCTTLYRLAPSPRRSVCISSVTTILSGEAQSSLDSRRSSLSSYRTDRTYTSSHALRSNHTDTHTHSHTERLFNPLLLFPRWRRLACQRRRWSCSSSTPST